MSRKRIHELAKKLGVETRQVLAQLESLHIHGKKAQSTLSKQEAESVHQALSAQAAPTLVLGEEKIIAERMVTDLDHHSEQVVTAREEIRENRIRPDVIRRRRRVEVVTDTVVAASSASASALFSAPAASPELAPAIFSAPTIEEPLPAFTPAAFDLSASEPIPVSPEPPKEESFSLGIPAESTSEPIELKGESGAPESSTETPPLVEPRADNTTASEEATQQEKHGVPEGQPEQAEQASIAATQIKAAQGSEPSSPSENGADVGARSARVLGRIDLDKLAETRTRQPGDRPRPAPSAPSLARPGTPEPSVGDGVPSGGKRKGKKRKIVRNAESLDVREREPRVARGGNRKKRALPGKEQRQTEITVPKASKRVVRISEVITVGELAHSLGVKVGEVIKKLMGLDVMATINQVLDHDTASLVAAEFEYRVENVAFDVDSVLEDEHEASEDEGELESRPPVVTIMGHVDHGKTSLLDKIRETNVTAHEQGGITQHIGAYSVPVADRSVTFLDTPGHEAFTSMRARGAKATDIVTLVVAADDGVMPQTIEAINHARAAEVPMIVAVNKIDKPGADVDRVKRELLSHGLIAEDMGGDAIFVPVSAMTGEGIEHLLEMILLQTDVMELRANPDKAARGVVIEAQLDKGRGPVATVLVQEGTLKIGDPFVCGAEHGRVRAMVDSHGDKVEIASPSMPVEVLGLTGVPEAGDTFVSLADEAKGRQIAEHRRAKRREMELTKSSRTSLEDFYKQTQAGEVKELRVIIKADVHGSAEAVRDALSRLSTDEVKLIVLHASVGGISESDVLLASASKGVIIGFNVRPETKAARLADREGIDLRLYGIIYEAIAEVRAAMEGLLAPTYKENPLGRAEVREVFSVSKIGLVAGCMVVEGKINRGAQVRVVRDHAVVHDGRLSTLRRFKDDVREVTAGTECGASVENFQDVKAGDILEVYELEEVARRLDDPRSQEVEQRAP